jgi:hypothetical protein
MCRGDEERATLRGGNPEASVASSDLRDAGALPTAQSRALGVSDRSALPYNFAPLPTDEAALIVVRFYLSPPAASGEAAKNDVIDNLGTKTG